MNRKKVIIFIDTDKDDLFSICLDCAQHYYGIIEIVGIVIESGFIINIQDGLLITQQWLNKLNVGTNLDKKDKNDYPIKINLYAGFPRPKYLDKRLFPKDFVQVYLNLIKKNFGIIIPNYNYVTGNYTNMIIETGAPSVDKLFSILEFNENKSIKCITTSPTTSLALGLDKYSFLSLKIQEIYSMTSNYLVPGNVLQKNNDDANIFLPKPYSNYSGEYNAFMNPSSLQRICLSVKDNINVNLVPLDCTNYAPLTLNTVNELKKIAEPFLPYITNPWVKNLYKNFILMVSIGELSESAGLYLWDLCVTNIALGSKIEQNYILGTPIISVTGKTESYYYTKEDNVKIYTYINYKKLLVNSIRILFNDEKYKDI